MPDVQNTEVSKDTEKPVTETEDTTEETIEGTADGSEELPEDVLELELPDVDFNYVESWAHKTIVKANAVYEFTKSSEGKPQLQVTLTTEDGRKQMFWARLGLESSHWMLERLVLPLINVVRIAKNQVIIPFSSSIEAKHIDAFLESKWVQKKMKSGLEVTCITDQNRGRDRQVRPRLRFLHNTEEGTDAIMETIDENRAANRAVANVSRRGASSSNRIPRSAPKIGADTEAGDGVIPF